MACNLAPPEATAGAANPRAGEPARWYVRPALERHRASLLIAGLVALSGCGGGERQDENEPDGDFPVEVVRASFPDAQKLAKSSKLRITVRNAGKRTIPNVALTIDGFDYQKKGDGELADTSRPVFAVDGVPIQIGGLPEAKEATPVGCDTAYVSTWACGPLRPGRERSFEWSVTAVRAGPYRIRWSVAAGLDGNARAVTPGGDRVPRGSFTGTISDEAPEVRVADDGKTVVTGTR